MATRSFWRCTWTRAQSSFHSRIALPNDTSASAILGAESASIGCTGRKSWREYRASAGSPSVSTASATAPRSPASITARRTFAAGSPAAFATASVSTPSRAPWRTSPMASAVRNDCSSAVPRASSSARIRCRSAPERLPRAFCSAVKMASTSARVSSGVVAATAGRASATLAHPTPSLPWRGHPIRKPVAIGISLGASRLSNAARSAIFSSRPLVSATSFEVRTRSFNGEETMMNWRWLLLAWAAPLGAQSTTDWPNLAKYRDSNTVVGARVVFMGNSITEGWKKYWFTGKPYVNRGIGGQTTPQMLVRFHQDVIALHPQVVVILAGTNDIAGNTGPSTLEMIEDNLAGMAEMARANGIRVVLCSVLPVYDYPWKRGLEPAPKIVALNAWMRRYADSTGSVYVDYHGAMRDDRNGMRAELASDGVHPNEAGYKIMVPLVEQGIADALRRSRSGSRRPD